MQRNKKLIAGIAAFATTVTYAIYRRRGSETAEETIKDTDAPVA